MGQNFNSTQFLFSWKNLTENVVLFHFSQSDYSFIYFDEKKRFKVRGKLKFVFEKFCEKS